MFCLPERLVYQQYNNLIIASVSNVFLFIEKIKLYNDIFLYAQFEHVLSTTEWRSD